MLKKFWLILTKNAWAENSIVKNNFVGENFREALTQLYINLPIKFAKLSDLHNDVGTNSEKYYLVL
jgi:hypothetical protein